MSYGGHSSIDRLNETLRNERRNAIQASAWAIGGTRVHMAMMRCILIRYRTAHGCGVAKMSCTKRGRSKSLDSWFGRAG